MQASVYADFGTLIHTAIEQEVARIIEAEKEELQKRVAARVRGAVGMMAAKILENFSYERVDRDLVIRVQFAFPEAKPTP